MVCYQVKMTQAVQCYLVDRRHAIQSLRRLCLWRIWLGYKPKEK